MTKKEAISCMLNGKKVRRVTWLKNTYLYMDYDCAIHDSENKEWHPSRMIEDDWEIHEEPKTESWAKFRVWDSYQCHWYEIPEMHQDLRNFEEDYSDDRYSNHHEIPNTRVELPIVMDKL